MKNEEKILKEARGKIYSSIIKIKIPYNKYNNYIQLFSKYVQEGRMWNEIFKVFKEKKPSA